MTMVKVIELPAKTGPYAGLYSVERIDSGKRMMVPVAGLAPADTNGDEEIRPEDDARIGAGLKIGVVRQVNQQIARS